MSFISILDHAGLSCVEPDHPQGEVWSDGKITVIIQLASWGEWNGESYAFRGTMDDHDTAMHYGNGLLSEQIRAARNGLPR